MLLSVPDPPVLPKTPFQPVPVYVELTSHGGFSVIPTARIDIFVFLIYDQSKGTGSPETDLYVSGFRIYDRGHC